MKVKNILEIARAEIGVRESPAGSNRTKYGAVYGWQGVPWCAIFVWWVFRQAGAETLLPCKTASCWQLMDAAQKAGLWVTGDFRPGDVLIYDFPGGASTDHTGICESVGDGYIVAIEGNTGTGNDANGGSVMRRKRKLSLVKGAVRPKYASEKPLALIAQEILDGRWGNGDTRRQRLTEAGYNAASAQVYANALNNGALRVAVTASALTVRAKPDKNSQNAGRLSRGNIVDVKQIREGNGAEAWGRISSGWISLDYVELL